MSMFFVLVNRIISLCKWFDTLVTWLVIQGVLTSWFAVITGSVLISQLLVASVLHQIDRLVFSGLATLFVIGLVLYSCRSKFGQYLKEVVVVQILQVNGRYSVRWNNGGCWYRVWFTSNKVMYKTEQRFNDIVKKIMEHNDCSQPKIIKTFRSGLTRNGA